MLEDYSLKATDLLLKLDQLRDALSNQELPESIGAAKMMLEGNVQLRRRVAKAPVDSLEVDARRVIERIYSAPCCARDVNSDLRSNPDFQRAAHEVSRLLEECRTLRQRLQQLWNGRKSRLEQCLQLRLIEQDVDKVCNQESLFTIYCSTTVS
jgi:hypothetical protein